MANLSGVYDPTNGEVAQDRGPIPVGEYVVAMAKCDQVTNKNGAGWHLAAEFEVLDGPHKGRRVWGRFNLENQSAQAKEIGWRDFNALKHACGRLNVTDTDQLLGIPFIMRVGTPKNEPERREPKGYKPMNGQPAAAAAPMQQPAYNAQQPAPAAGGAPWGRR